MVARLELAGRVALITGGDRGIGLATARLLARRGARVAMLGHDPAAVELAAASMDPARTLGIVADVTDDDALLEAVADTIARFGALDVVVANAGIAARVASFQATTSENLERVIDVNMMGVCRTVRAALPEIVRARGHVTIVSSIYAFINGVGTVPYAMAKAAIEQLGRALRVELARHGASAGVAYFGFVDTDMLHRALDADPLAEELKGVFPAPLRKRVTPEDAAEAIVRGIEARRARVVLPRRWGAVLTLRGLAGPIGDALMERDPRLHELVRQLDERARETQPRTS